MKRPAAETDRKFMARAVALARHGQGHVSPNPMVGCVIVSADGRIIGEGWHRLFGSGHAEVNAMRSVTDTEALRGATAYVTLEPCSHYGKTPPCAEMLAASPIERVVVGMTDPNPKVSGRGIARLREAGKTVSTGVLRQNCEDLNPHFLTAQRHGRPFVTLKFACDASGAMGWLSGRRSPLYSNPLTQALAHRERTAHDAILVGRRTALADNPSLTSRYWPGRNPVPIVTGGEGAPLPSSLTLARNPHLILAPRITDPVEFVRGLWLDRGISSLLVEGGGSLLRGFIDAGVFDIIRREVNPARVGGDLTAPAISEGCELISTTRLRGNTVEYWTPGTL